MKAKTHCKRGHLFSEDNTWSYKGKRYCRACRRKRDLEYYHGPGNAKRKAYHSKWTKANRKSENLKNVLAKYKITLTEYQKMHEEQHDCCFLCGENTKLYVDHNHKTNKIRKLLCRSCNFGLGLFQESPELLRKAASYCEVFNVVTY